jgi:DNA-binding NarL/FixJ family response regulator
MKPRDSRNHRTATALSNKLHNEGRPLRVAVVEVDVAMQAVITDVVRRRSGAWSVETFSGSGKAAKGLPSFKPGIILIGATEPGHIRGLNQLVPDAKLVVLLSPARRDIVPQFIGCGVRGIVTHPASRQEIANALAGVARGQCVLPDWALAAMVDWARMIGQNAFLDHGLTSREYEVLDSLAKGKSQKLTAVLLGVEFSTVHEHVKRIFAKLGVCSRDAAIRRIFGFQPGSRPLIFPLQLPRKYHHFGQTGQST